MTLPTFRKTAFDLGILALLSLPVPANAQWTWTKRTSVSSETTWDGMTRDSVGNIFCAGVSNKLPSPNTRAFVVARYRQDTVLAWNSRLVGTGFSTGHSTVALDAKGHVYVMGLFKNAVTRPDSTTFTSALDACFIAKFDTTGKHIWSKPLGFPDYRSFQVTADGTLGVHANITFATQAAWGDTTFAVTAGDYLLEFDTDGNLARKVKTLELTPATTVRQVWWREPGRLRIVHGRNSPYPNEPHTLKVSEADLETKAIAPAADSAVFIPTAANELSFQQFEYEEKTGNLFVMATVRTGKAVLNGKDTLSPWPDNQLRLHHLIELNPRMEVEGRFMLSNPQVFAVRDSQIAVAAIVHRSSGFISDHDTLKVGGPDDSHVLYVIGRDYKFRKKAFIISPGSGSSGNVATRLVIDGEGAVFLNMTAHHTLSYIRASDTVHITTPLATSASVSAISKLGNPAPLSIAHRGSAARFRAMHLRLEAHADQLRIDRKGAFKYSVSTLSGKILLSGRGRDRVFCDLGGMASGSYLVRTVSGNRVESAWLRLE